MQIPRYRPQRQRTDIVQRGFTIVELLVVIVVIAVLASITTVSYSGIQTRANNVAVLTAAKQAQQALLLYIANNNSYPLTGGDVGVCITTTCATLAGTTATYTNAGYLSTFGTNMATIGTLPKSVPGMNGADHYGIIYSYVSTRTVDSVIVPAVLLYWLQGTSQSCGLSGVTSIPGGNTAVLNSTTTAYTLANDSSSGKTLCLISIPGPSA